LLNTAHCSLVACNKKPLIFIHFEGSIILKTASSVILGIRTSILKKIYIPLTVEHNYCLQFTDDPTVAICSDSGGSVFVLSFK